MGAPIVAGSDASPVLESSKHILDLMTFFVKFGVVRDEGVAIFLRRYARRHAFGFQSGSKPGGVIASISDHLFGLG